MSLEGMDVDEMRGLAQQLGTDLDTLNRLLATVSGLVGRLPSLWQGPAASAFEADWQSRYRPGLLGAVSTLTALHAHLVSNISQQQSASAADGGWTAGRVVGDVENVITAVRNSPTAERVVGDTENVLTGAGLIGLAVKAPVLDQLGEAGTAVSAFHMAEDEVHLDEALVDGHYVDAANDMTDEFSDGLKTISGVTPWPYNLAFEGAGADVKLLDEVANLDWKDTPSPFSGSNWEQDYVPEFKSMGTGAYWEQAGKTLWGAL